MGRRRHVWSSPGRLYVEAHGVHGPRGEQVARRIERAVDATGLGLAAITMRDTPSTPA